VKTTSGVFASVFISVALLSGCGEGYPTQDEGLNLNFALGVQDTIQAMTQLASESALWGSYEFSVSPDCTLTIERQRLFFWRSQSHVNLKTARFEVRANDGAYDLVAWHPNQAEEQTVIEQLPRFVSQDGLWLLKYMVRLC